MPLNPITKGVYNTKPNLIEPRVRLLTIRQAARLIVGLTEYRIRRLCASGELPCLMSGNRRLINERTLMEYVGAKTSAPSGEFSRQFAGPSASDEYGKA